MSSLKHSAICFKLMPQSSSITIGLQHPTPSRCVLAFSLFFFWESFHALLKRRAVHIVWIHHVPGSNVTGFMPHRAQCFVFASH